MGTGVDAELNIGDNIVFLLDREQVTDEDLADTADAELVRMANEWLREQAARFFITVARQWKPVPDTELNTFASHDDRLVFLDKAALLAAIPELATDTAGALWLILAAPDVERAVRKVIAGKRN